MKSVFRRALVIAVPVILLALTTIANAATCAVGQYDFGTGCVKPSPDQGLQLLLDGNSKFALGTGNNHLDAYATPAIRQEVAGGQHPFAIVLTCSDSRVPPEILFDKGLGEIFVVRVAGNIVDPHELGSIEYAIEHLGANLVVVLGHSKCGAVKSTYATYPAHLDPHDGIGSLVESIWPAVDKVVTDEGGKPAGAPEQATQIEACVVENINMVAESLGTRSTIIEEKKLAGDIKIVRAKYDLGTGAVTVLP